MYLDVNGTLWTSEELSELYSAETIEHLIHTNTLIRLNEPGLSM